MEKPYRVTERQWDPAERAHALAEEFMDKKHLDRPGFYETAAYGYLDAVKTYLGKEAGKETPASRPEPDETETNADFREDFMLGHLLRYCLDKDNRNFNEDYVTGRLVKRAIRKIHDAGGCGAEDGYSEGYDAAITLALDILLEETGYVLEDVLDEEEEGEDGTV